MSSQPLRQNRHPSKQLLRRGRTFTEGKGEGDAPHLPRMSVPRRNTLGLEKDCMDFLWEAFDEMGPDEWVLPARVDPTQQIQDVLVNQYKDRNVDGTPLFAVAEYCAHVVTNEGRPDSWRRKRRCVEDVPCILKAVLAAKADPNAKASHKKGTMQAIHYAAGLGVVPVMEALLEAAVEAAPPDMPRDTVQTELLNSRTQNEDGQEHYMPLHDAVWFKRFEATEWLLLHSADPNAQNLMGWTALHIVARQGQGLEFIDLLIRFGAELRRQDNHGNNPLMTAVNRPIFPVSKFHLLAASCHDPKSTFLAYLRDIYSLAVENEEACEEFVEVLLGRHPGELAANDQPGSDSDVEVTRDRPFRFMLSVDTATARSGQESKKALGMMAEVMEKAPRAAAMILDVLVGMPMVKCPEHHPLPRRANMLIDGCEERMICDYQPDYFEEEDDGDNELSWMSRISLGRAQSPADRRRRGAPKRSQSMNGTRMNTDGAVSDAADSHNWEALRKNLLPKVSIVRKLTQEVGQSGKCRLPCWGFDTLTNTPPSWHSAFAPLTEKRNDDKEVKVEVLKMPDLLDVRVFRVLANTEHLSLFAEKTVQGMVNCLWHRLVKHGVRWGIVMDVLTLVTLLLWITITEFVDGLLVPGRRSFWLVTVATVLKELYFLGYSMLILRWLGRPWAYLSSGDVMADIVATCLLLALAVYTMEDFEVPLMGWGRSILALNVLMRWFQITYMCRPFPKVGKKIVCVLKSFMPMKEMMFITAVVFFGFAVAALLIKDNSHMECKDHCSATVLMNLFKALLMGDGDGFSDLLTLPGGDSSGVFAGALFLMATVIFSVSVLNLLIAVYGNEYDRKEKQSDLLFHQERAGICFRHLMEPLWPSWRTRPAWLWHRWEIWQGRRLKTHRAQEIAAEAFIRRLVGGTVCMLFVVAFGLAEAAQFTVLPVLLVFGAMLLVQLASKRCDWHHFAGNEDGRHFYLWICSQSGVSRNKLLELGFDDVNKSVLEVHAAVRQMSRSMEKQMGELRQDLQTVSCRVDDISRLATEELRAVNARVDGIRGQGPILPGGKVERPASRESSASPRPPNSPPSAAPHRRSNPSLRAMPAAVEELRRLQREVSERQQRRAEELASACSPRAVPRINILRVPGQMSCPVPSPRSGSSSTPGSPKLFEQVAPTGRHGKAG